jgi:hypothetical protein
MIAGLTNQEEPQSTRYQKMGNRKKKEVACARSAPLSIASLGRISGAFAICHEHYLLQLPPPPSQNICPPIQLRQRSQEKPRKSNSKRDNHHLAMHRTIRGNLTDGAIMEPISIKYPAQANTRARSVYHPRQSLSNSIRPPTRSGRLVLARWGQ